jgi:hypothetical protein
MIGDSVPFAAAAASCPVCLRLSKLLLTLQTMSTGNPGSLPKRSISSKMPGCSHGHFPQTSEAAPMASLSLPSSQGRSEGRAVRPEWCLRCTMRRRSRSPTPHMRVRSLVSRPGLPPTSHCLPQLPPRSQLEATSARRPARDQRRRPGRSGKERPRRFRFGQAARAHYARNKLLGLLPLIISGPHFRPRRHRLTADDYRTEMADRFATWNDITRSSEAA